MLFCKFKKGSKGFISSLSSHFLTTFFSSEIDVSPLKLIFLQRFLFVAARNSKSYFLRKGQEAEQGGMPTTPTTMTTTTPPPPTTTSGSEPNCHISFEGGHRSNPGFVFNPSSLETGRSFYF